MTLIKSGIRTNVNVSAKIKENIICIRNIIFRILVYVLVKMVDI